MNDAPCAGCGRTNHVTAPHPRQTMHPLARGVRWLLQPLGWFTHALTLVACAFSLWAMALHWIVPFMGLVELGFLGLWWLVGFIWTIRLATRGAIWLFQPTTRQTRRPGARSFLVLPLCALTLAVLNRFDVPLRLVFRWNQPALEHWARTAPFEPQGMTFINYFPVPYRADYRIKRVDVGQNGVRIEVTDNVFLSGGTKAGFAFCPQGCNAAGFTPAFAQHNEKPVYIRLSRDWNWWQQLGSADF